MAFRPLTLAALAVAAFATLAAAQSTAQSAPQGGALNVDIDQSARVRLRAPASSVVVGNPAIADVTVVDAYTLFITGKGYGVTEVAAVDGSGRTVFQNRVVVSGGGDGTVRIWRGAQATEMVCGATCAPSMRGGQSSGATPSAAPATQ